MTTTASDPGCVFCGGRPLVEAPLWPEWVRSRGAETGSACRSCREGWMRRLDAEAAPVLAPLIQGHARAISAADQELVAAWAAMLAVSCSRLGSDGYAERRVPPAGWRVWVAAYSGSAWTTLVYRHPLRITPDPSDKDAVNAHLTTLGAGRLVVQVLGTRLEHALAAELGDAHELPFREALTPVWPAAAITPWRPEVVLDDALLSRLIDGGFKPGARRQGAPPGTFRPRA